MEDTNGVNPPLRSNDLLCGSLFSGIGGMDLGLERAGFKVIWQVEKDEYCRRVLRRHWPDVRQWDDVRTWPQPDTEPVDFVFGGDPCQANSAAIGGHQSRHESLGGEFLRIINELRPRIVLRENPAHIRRDAPWPWWRFRAGLESIGYAVLPFRLRACCVGAFHQRERVFLLAELANSNRERLAWRQASHEARHAKKLAGSMDAEVWESVFAGRGFGSRAGVPDYVERMRGIGNAVMPQVAEWIGQRLMAAIVPAV